MQLRLINCEIVTEDEVHEFMDDGFVTVIGESPNAIVKISRPNAEKTKAVQVDHLTGCTLRKSGETLEIIGQSSYVRDVIGSESATLTILVTPEPPCKDCP